ncbi:MAG: hypothetical protein WA705_01170 [Candidatus Ozemobacteraceae bacterium]
MKKFCWEVYNKSECEVCHFFRTYTDGKLDIEKNKEVILIDEE